MEPGKKTKLPDDFNSRSNEDQIKWLYEHGRGSMQDYARIYRYSMDEILTILGHNDLKTVQTQGDLVDESELMPGTSINPGDLHRVNYNTD